MRVIVAGGTGFIGQAVVRRLAADGHEVAVVTRTPNRPSNTVLLGWDEARAAVDGADAVVNLAGESIGGRWTRARKERILRSRVETTTALVDAIAAARRPPGVLVNSSGIDYVGDTADAVVTEDAAPGDTFLARVCIEWERAAQRAPVRTVLVRTPLTIGRAAPAVRLLALPFRLFAGGRLGNGRQWFPWIHVDDIVGIIMRAIDGDGLAGPVNAVAPEQLRQADAARDLGRVLHRPALVPTPAPALRALLGEQADLLLHGQRAVSTKLDEFAFRYPTLRAALEEALA